MSFTAWLTATIVDLVNDYFTYVNYNSYKFNRLVNRYKYPSLKFLYIIFKDDTDMATYISIQSFENQSIDKEFLSSLVE